jgi:hypothetical protein
MLKTSLVVSITILVSAANGMAQSAAMKACVGDVKSLCAGTQPGDGRVKACIKSHLSEISDPCKDAVSQATAGKS